MFGCPHRPRQLTVSLRFGPYDEENFLRSKFRFPCCRHAVLSAVFHDMLSKKNMYHSSAYPRHIRHLETPNFIPREVKHTVEFNGNGGRGASQHDVGGVLSSRHLTQVTCGGYWRVAAQYRPRSAAWQPRQQMTSTSGSSRARSRPSPAASSWL